MKKEIAVVCLSVVVMSGALVGCGAADTNSSQSSSSAVSSVQSSSSQPTKISVGTKETQTIGLTSVSNARQLGGYVGANGKTVKKDVVLRTGKLKDATKEDINKLINTYNLKKVIDFRTTSEKESDPNPNIEGVLNLPISIVDESVDDASKAVTAGLATDPVQSLIDYARSTDLSNMYVDIVTSAYSQKGYQAFFQELLNNQDGAILFHCTSGKDRAGIAGVLFLSALGVDRETALNDFELSNVFYKEKIEKMGKAAKDKGCTEQEVESVKTLAGVSRAYMEKALDAIDTQYGSMGQYLKNQMKLSDQDIQKLQDKYLVAS